MKAKNMNTTTLVYHLRKAEKNGGLNSKNSQHLLDELNMRPKREIPSHFRTVLGK